MFINFDQLIAKVDYDVYYRVLYDHYDIRNYVNIRTDKKIIIIIIIYESIIQRRK